MLLVQRRRNRGAEGLDPPTSPGGGAEPPHFDYLAKDQWKTILKLLYLLK